MHSPLSSIYNGEPIAVGHILAVIMFIAKFCPLCNAVVRFHYINLKEKLFMCENTRCEFPFGYEALQIITVGSEVNSDAPSSVQHNRSSSSSGTSTKSCSEIDKLNKICEIEKENLLNVNVTPEKSEKEKNSDDIINNTKIENNLQNLKCLTMELNEIEQKREERDVIKNEKWIKKLMKLQGMSGVQLVKKREMDLLKGKSMKPMFGGGELKIDIDTDGHNMSSINVQIMH